MERIDTEEHLASPSPAFPLDGSSQPIKGKKPMDHYCRFCKYKGPTEIRKAPGRCQKMACFSFLSVILIPLSIAACTTSVFYETEHVCGKCHRHIAVIYPCS
eukprot:TRINITY_DN1101_c0_g1_i2.p2 TRINITY_DN1101_c0_g1~~TRINITY_DN1101_c0_g1_i2.p2  ORF type:complete len:102 (+),score=21.68 TRINITY_DN1101_c0_g1_i2:114-419(+)